ncbi:MAG: hypothetical protein E7374_03285 [Clostridiales bacterium]|nr:hypothetical protein [Clostridiales bacterium]
MDKTFSKIYNVPCGSFVIFLLSTLSGYPMGAKLICYMYDTKAIDQKDAKKMMSFCSVSGPMFMVATIGIGVLSSFKAGIIILISNIIASLINGLLFRKGKTSYKQNILKKTNENLLTNSVYDSIISILMVGGFIVFSFLIIDILEFLKIFNLFSSILPIKFQESFSAILKGLIEMTRGIIDLGKTNLTLKSKTVISSALIGFGGTSIFMQSLAFLSKLKFKFTDMLKQKCFQGILAGFIAFLLSFVVFC